MAKKAMGREDSRGMDMDLDLGWAGVQGRRVGLVYLALVSGTPLPRSNLEDSLFSSNMDTNTFPLCYPTIPDAIIFSIFPPPPSSLRYLSL